MYLQRQPSGGALSGTQSSMNQDGSVHRPHPTHIPQTPSGLRGVGPQRQFHWGGQSGSPSLLSQGNIGQGNPHAPQTQITPSQRGFGMRGGSDAGPDNSFRPTTQQRDRGASPKIFSPDYSFPDFDDLVDSTNPDDPLEGSSYRYSGGNQSSQVVRAPVTMHPCHCTVVDRLVEDAVKHRWKIIRVLCTQLVAHLTASVERLNEVNVTLTDELTSIKDENKSFAARLTKIEEFVSKLEERADIKPVKTRVCIENSAHIDLQSILHPLFCKLCGIECDSTKTDHIAALDAVRPLDNKQPFEVSSDGVEIWHPNWLGDVCDNVNAKFINNVADCAFNNEKRVKELETDEKRQKAEAKRVQSRKRAHRSTVTLQHGQQSGNAGAEGLIETDLGSEILTCNESDDTCQRRKDAEVGKDAKMVVGHAWQSIDYGAFLRWLSFHTKVQDEPGEPAKDQEHPPKRRKTTRKFHKRVFDLALKHLNCNAPPPKATICKAMVDEGWHQKHPGRQLVEGTDWLTGFYSHVNKEELYDADVDYLKELDEYLKSQARSEENI
ncbi:hypothetical protein V8B97DRAFT_2104073 [Scleroderma yunnanense]